MHLGFVPSVRKCHIIGGVLGDLCREFFFKSRANFPFLHRIYFRPIDIIDQLVVDVGLPLSLVALLETATALTARVAETGNRSDGHNVFNTLKILVLPHFSAQVLYLGRRPHLVALELANIELVIVLLAVPFLLLPILELDLLV